MTDMVRLFNESQDDRMVIHNVDSAIEGETGVAVEHEHDQRTFYEGYELVGFGR